MSYLLIVAGFVVLTLGADWLVDGASAIARRLKVSDLLIGLTVVAFGTSMPELVVNIVAAVEDNNEIALTNILGSNSINVFVILGLTALVCPLTSQRSMRRFELPLSVLAGVFALLLGMDFFVGDAPGGIGRTDGLLLLAVFAVFMFQTTRTGIKNGNEAKTSDEKGEKPVLLALLLIVAGLVGLVGGGELIVKNAVKIARAWGVSDAVIGVTVVALGTSLPELATSVMAASKKNVDLAIGNVVGSNIFNVFFVLGISSVIRPLDAYPNLLADAFMAFLGSLLVLLFVQGRRHRVERWQGALLLMVYALYLWMLIRGVSQ